MKMISHVGKRLVVALGLAMFLLPGGAQAWPYGYWGPGWGYGYPSGYGYRYNKMWRVGKVDLDADLNYDGVINNGDPGDGGTREDTPPGLVVGSGEMTKLVLRIAPNSIQNTRYQSEPRVDLDFSKLVVSLDLRGINLSDKKGRFGSFQEEVQRCGQVRIWSDHKKSFLLLDSSDANKRRIEWPMDLAEAPYSVYVEGVRPGSAGATFFVTLELDDSRREGFLSKIFNEASAWDSLIVTCKAQPVPKVEPNPATDVLVISGYNSYGGFGATEKDSRKIWIPAPSK